MVWFQFFFIFFCMFLNFSNEQIMPLKSERKLVLAVSKSCLAWGKSKRKIAHGSKNPHLPHDHIPSSISLTSLVQTPDGWGLFSCAQASSSRRLPTACASPGAVKTAFGWAWSHTVLTHEVPAWGCASSRVSVSTCHIRRDTLQWLFPHPSRPVLQVPLICHCLLLSSLIIPYLSRLHRCLLGHPAASLGMLHGQVRLTLPRPDVDDTTLE